MATTFTNQATLSYNGTSVLSNVAVGILEQTLSITKYAVEDAYGEGDTLTYLVNIINSSDTALTGLTLQDNLGAYAFGDNTVQPLSYVAGSVQVYADGVLQPDPAVDTADGLTLNDLSVPAQGNTTVIYQATVNRYAPLAQGDAITNTVTVSGAGIAQAQAQATVPAEQAARLTVLKSVSPVPVAENGRLTYSFRLLNNGNTAVSAEDNAVISDTFDPVLSDLAVTLDGTARTGSSYTYDEASGVFATVPGIITVPAATCTQDPVTGEMTVIPGETTLTVTGTVGTL